MQISLNLALFNVKKEVNNSFKNFPEKMQGKSSIIISVCDT